MRQSGNTVIYVKKKKKKSLLFYNIYKNIQLQGKSREIEGKKGGGGEERECERVHR